MNLDKMILDAGRKEKTPSRDEWLTRDINSQIEGVKDTSKISDGSHTFEELYHHRAMLFAVICNSNKDISWKSHFHSSGDMMKNFFIVGIDTPEGQYSYHYPVEYWKTFKVEIRELAPEWDGHRSEDIGRLLSL